jgi:hypothetical protein
MVSGSVLASWMTRSRTLASRSRGRYQPRISSSPKLAACSRVLHPAERKYLHPTSPCWPPTPGCGSRTPGTPAAAVIAAGRNARGYPPPQVAAPSVMPATRASPGQWHREDMTYHGMVPAVRRLSRMLRGPGGWSGLALGGAGGAGLARVLVHLFIWRLLIRGGAAIWRVPVFGPVIDIVLGLVVVGLLVVRSQRGPGWWRRGPGGGPGAGGYGTRRG